MDPSNEGALERAFKAYCLHGAGAGVAGRMKWEMDNPRFVKWCREAGLIGREWPTGIDIAFTRARKTPDGPNKHGRRVDYITLRGLLIPLLAEEFGMAPDDVVARLSAARPVNRNATAFRTPPKRREWTTAAAMASPAWEYASVPPQQTLRASALKAARRGYTDHPPAVDTPSPLLSRGPRRYGSQGAASHRLPSPLKIPRVDITEEAPSEWSTAEATHRPHDPRPAGAAAAQRRLQPAVPLSLGGGGHWSPPPPDEDGWYDGYPRVAAEGYGTGSPKRVASARPPPPAPPSGSGYEPDDPFRAHLRDQSRYTRSPRPATPPPASPRGGCALPARTPPPPSPPWTHQSGAYPSGRCVSPAPLATYSAYPAIEAFQRGEPTQPTGWVYRSSRPPPGRTLYP